MTFKYKNLAPDRVRSEQFVLRNNPIKPDLGNGTFVRKIITFITKKSRMTIFPFCYDHKKIIHPKIRIRLNQCCQKGRNYVHLALKHLEPCYSFQVNNV